MYARYLYYHTDSYNASAETKKVRKKARNEYDEEQITAKKRKPGKTTRDVGFEEEEEDETDEGLELEHKAKAAGNKLHKEIEILNFWHADKEADDINLQTQLAQVQIKLEKQIGYRNAVETKLVEVNIRLSEEDYANGN
ncbi:hypothetical protein RHS03_00219, partial [Rhizoctonia solani]